MNRDDENSSAGSARKPRPMQVASGGKPRRDRRSAARPSRGERVAGHSALAVDSAGHVKGFDLRSCAVCSVAWALSTPSVLIRFESSKALSNPFGGYP